MQMFNEIDEEFAQMMRDDLEKSISSDLFMQLSNFCKITLLNAGVSVDNCNANGEIIVASTFLSLPQSVQQKLIDDGYSIIPHEIVVVNTGF